MSGEYRMRVAEMAVPCPECGNRLWLFNDYHRAPELGGDYEGEGVSCERCGREWSQDDGSPLPDGFTVGEYWNVVLEQDNDQ